MTTSKPQSVPSLEIMEACIDIANYIIPIKGFQRAEGYSEMFKILKGEP